MVSENLLHLFPKHFIHHHIHILSFQVRTEGLYQSLAALTSILFFSIQALFSLQLNLNNGGEGSRGKSSLCVADICQPWHPFKSDLLQCD